MVTKGYRKGVYDRVTEGTWERGPGREKQISIPCRQSSVIGLQQEQSGSKDGLQMGRRAQLGESAIKSDS